MFPFPQSLPPKLAVLLGLSLLVLPSCSSRVHGPTYAPPQPASCRVALVRLGQALEGLPYAWGGSDIDGFDCSGLVHYIYGCFGLSLPRTAEEMARQMSHGPVTRPPRGGDVLLFRNEGQWHVGLALDGKSFLHAPKAGERVRSEPLNRFWRAQLKGLLEPPQG